MKYTHIGPNNKDSLATFSAAIDQKRPVFVLFYMEGCGPCNETRPEWKKLATASGLPSNLQIYEIDRDLLDSLKNRYPKLGNIMGFPSMKYIRGADSMEDYEGGRTIDDFVRWIKSKSSRGGGRTRHRRHRHHHTRKYITCRRRRHRGRRRSGA